MALFRNPFHRLQPARALGGDDSATISRVEDLITSAWDVFLSDLERFLVGAGIATPGVPPNPAVVNTLTGPAVVWTDGTGRLRVDPIRFTYTPGTATSPSLLVVGNDVKQGTIATFIAKIGGTSPGIIASGENATANPLTTGQPFLSIDNTGGNFSGLAFRFAPGPATHCGFTAGIDGSILVSVPDANGAHTNAFSVFSDLAQTVRMLRVAPAGVTVDSLAGLANGALTADAAGKLQKVPTLTIVDDPIDSAVQITATNAVALELGAGGTPNWVTVEPAGTVAIATLAGVGNALVQADHLGNLSRATAAAAYQSFQWSGLITDPSWQAISGDVRAVWCPSDAGRCAAVPIIANGRTGDTTVPAYLTDTLGSVIGYQVTPMHITSGIRTLVEAAVCIQSLIPTFVAPADAIGFRVTVWKVTGGFPQSNPANYTAMATAAFSFPGAGFQQAGASMAISVAAISELDFLFCEVHRTDTSGANVLSSMTFTVNARFST